MDTTFDCRISTHGLTGLKKDGHLNLSHLAVKQSKRDDSVQLCVWVRCIVGMMNSLWFLLYKEKGIVVIRQ